MHSLCLTNIDSDSLLWLSWSLDGCVSVVESIASSTLRQNVWCIVHCSKSRALRCLRLINGAYIWCCFLPLVGLFLRVSHAFGVMTLLWPRWRLFATLFSIHIKSWIGLILLFLLLVRLRFSLSSLIWFLTFTLFERFGLSRFMAFPISTTWITICLNSFF